MSHVLQLPEAYWPGRHVWTPWRVGGGLVERWLEIHVSPTGAVTLPDELAHLTVEVVCEVLNPGLWAAGRLDAQPAPAPRSITCPRCGATSHHPGDVEAGYCGRCHAVTRVDIGRKATSAAVLLGGDSISLAANYDGEVVLSCFEHSAWEPTGYWSLVELFALLLEHKAAMHR